MPPRWSKDKLPNIHESAPNVASNKVRVHALKIGGRKDAARQNAIAKARSKSLNLSFQPFEHVYFASVRHMTIGPGRMFSRWSPRAIKQTGLSQQNERTLGVLSHSDRLFRGSAISSKAPPTCTVAARKHIRRPSME
jgi:hypothetical protein